MFSAADLDMERRRSMVCAVFFPLRAARWAWMREKPSSDIRRHVHFATDRAMARTSEIESGSAKPRLIVRPIATRRSRHVSDVPTLFAARTFWSAQWRSSSKSVQLRPRQVTSTSRSGCRKSRRSSGSSNWWRVYGWGANQLVDHRRLAGFLAIRLPYALSAPRRLVMPR